MTTQVEWISHEAAELPQLAEWDAHLACDFRRTGLRRPRRGPNSPQAHIEELVDLTLRGEPSRPPR